MNNNFYLAAFSHREVAKNLREYIDPQVAALLDWDSLRVETSKYVDADLRHREADLLYSLKLGDEQAYVYLLLEHQSQEDWLMAFRLQEYRMKIWGQHFKQHPGERSLPLIVPAVLYQGEKPWTPTPQFRDYFQLPSAQMALLEKYIPTFTCEFISLATLAEADIRGNAYIQAVFRLMRAAKRGDMLDCIDRIQPHLETIQDAHRDLDFTALCFTYAIHTADVDIQTAQDKFNHIRDPHLRTTAMTLAERLIDKGLHEGLNRGLSQGLSQGLVQGRVQMLHANVIEVLELRFEHVPAGLKDAIEQIGDESRLAQLHRAAVCCPSVEKFVEEL